MKTDKTRIMAVGLNPAWQKTLFFPEFIVDQINRAREIGYAVGGKGPNFVRAANTWGSSSVIFQFVGGRTGEKICNYLDDEGIKHESVSVSNPTRTCTTCLCEQTGTMTELIEPSGEVSKHYADELLELILRRMPEFSRVALCGTFPPGIGGDFYQQVAAGAKAHGIPVLLDAWRDIKATLREGVDILKINLTELLAISDCSNAQDGIAACFEKFPINAIAITDGAKAAYFATRDDFWSFKLPKLEKVINPLGAGDTASAVLLSELDNGASYPEAFASALAAASASCLNFKVAEFHLPTALELKTEIKIKKLEITRRTKWNIEDLAKVIWKFLQ